MDIEVVFLTEKSLNIIEKFVKIQWKWLSKITTKKIEKWIKIDLTNMKKVVENHRKTLNKNW